MKVNLALIRCGQTKGGAEGRCMGLTDEPLSAEGKRALAEKQAGGGYPGVELVYTGGLIRCVGSAGLMYPQLPAVVLKDLRPFHYGAFTGRTMAELQVDKRFAAWMEHGKTIPCPNGDIPLAFRERCARALRGIVDEMNAKGMESAAVVTHNTVIDAVMRRMAIPRSDYRSWETPWGSGWWVEYDSALYTIKRLAQI